MEAMIPIALFLSIAAVLILRPITRRLGLLLEAIARDRDAARAPARTDSRIVALLETMNQRLELMEERLDFTERLVSADRKGERKAMRGVKNSDADLPYLVP